MDLQLVNPLEWVKGNPRHFFLRDSVDAMRLLAFVMSDVLEIGMGECRISRCNSWWLVVSNIDWLRHPTISVAELFQRIVPAIEHGANSLRAEILLTAFATDVFTVCGGDELLIAGTPPDRQMLARAIDTNWYRRLVAFRLATQ